MITVNEVEITGTYDNFSSDLYRNPDSSDDTFFTVSGIKSDLQITITPKKHNPTIADAVEKTLGDLTDDGQIMSDDALHVLRASLGFMEYNDMGNVLADVNNDGAVNSEDALLLLRASIGIQDANTVIGKKVKINPYSGKIY